MSNHKTVEILNNVLANSYALALKTQNYHWNVVGPNFKSLHELFEEQYDDIFEAIDDIAERIRVLGPKVEGTFENFQTLTQFKNGDKDLSDKDMVRDLIEDHEALANLLKEGVKVAQSEDDEVTVGMLVDRAQSHEKTVWMLQSSI